MWLVLRSGNEGDMDLTSVCCVLQRGFLRGSSQHLRDYVSASSSGDVSFDYAVNHFIVIRGKVVVVHG